MEKLEKNENKTFEDIKHIDENGIEYWYARELMKVLSYKDWRYFDAVITKAKIACKNSKIDDIYHFVDDNKMVEIGSGAKREKKLKKDKIQTEKEANKAHYEVGSKIRNTIKELGETMPEDLPTPNKSLKELEKENNKSLKK